MISSTPAAFFVSPPRAEASSCVHHLCDRDVSPVAATDLPPMVTLPIGSTCFDPPPSGSPNRSRLPVPSISTMSDTIARTFHPRCPAI